jgi:PKHD-type hydroxylase
MNLLRLNKNCYPVYWEHNFLSDKEIQKILEYSSITSSVNAEIGNSNLENKKKIFDSDFHIKDTNLGYVPRERQSTIKWIKLNEETNWLYKKIIQQIHKVNQENFDYILKFVEDLQFAEYNENQKGFYSKHNDCGNKDDIENFVDVRKISFSIQLSDESEYEGGDLIFYMNGRKKIAPKSKGTIIFFKSDVVHEVKPVKTGIRYSLVSWVNGPNLK